MTPTCEALLHPALEPATAPPLAEARLSDRERVALLLQASSLLSHLGTAGWRLEAGWEGAAVDAGGILRRVTAVPGPPHQRPHRTLLELSRRLFGARRRIAGRGEARSVARRLADRWGSALTTISPDRAVGQVLDEADFLWQCEFGRARATLAAVHVRGDDRRLWLAGPSWFRQPVLARAASRRELEEALSSLDLLPLWRSPGRPGSAAGRLRSAVRAWRERPPRRAAERLEYARALYSLGRFEEALDVLDSRRSVECRLLRVRALHWLDRSAAALREIRALEDEPVEEKRLLEVARVAVSVTAGAGRHAEASRWVERGRQSAPGWLRPEAHLLAAEAAAARGDWEESRSALRRARVVREQSTLARRWFQVAGERALAEGNGREAAELFGRALGCGRRRLPPFEASSLWDRVAAGRLQAGDLAGGDRALTHAARLHSQAGEPCRTSPCLFRLAETRLRRGRPETLRDLYSRFESSGRFIREFFPAIGFGHVRLRRLAGGSETLLLDGVGGETEIAAPAPGGRLVASAPERSDRLATLVRVLADWLPELPEGEKESERRSGEAFQGDMVGRASSFLAALCRARRFAQSDLPVLITGETGTGKELLARRLHRGSARSSGPFLPVNCAAVSRELLMSDLFGHVRGAFTGADRDRAGVFEAARGGTVFLDEIGDLPATAQGALLRVLQEGEVRRLGEATPRQVDVRILAATHRSLRRLVDADQFRQDLFFRLHVATVELPPLRRRGRDVLRLCRHFLGRLRPGEEPEISAAARARLLAHTWPGNVRELENVVSVAVALAAGGRRLEAEHLELPVAGERVAGYHERILDLRRRLVHDALRASAGNQAAAARQLGLSRQALSYLVRKLDLET